jgi:hypothetical protein
MQPTVPKSISLNPLQLPFSNFLFFLKKKAVHSGQGTMLQAGRSHNFPAALGPGDYSVSDRNVLQLKEPNCNGYRIQAVKTRTLKTCIEQ